MGLAASRQEAFWEACGFGHIDKVKKFLTEDIDVNWKSYTHDCCAIHVASQGKPEIVQLLLDAECDVNVRDDRGNSALHHAAMKGHSDILKTLIKAGSEINAQDKNGWSSLHCAAYWAHPKAVKVLIDSGIDVHLQNKDQRTALHETARSKEDLDVELGEITQYLLEAGCDINAKSSDEGEADFTPLMFAAYHGHPEVAQALIGAGCDLDSRGTNLWTALHWATDRQNEEVVYILLEAGADPTCQGLRGELAADRSPSNPDLRNMLLDAINMYRELSSIGGVNSIPSSIATTPDAVIVNKPIPLVQNEDTDLIETEALEQKSAALVKDDSSQKEINVESEKTSSIPSDGLLSEALDKQLNVRNPTDSADQPLSEHDKTNSDQTHSESISLEQSSVENPVSDIVHCSETEEELPDVNQEKIESKLTTNKVSSDETDRGDNFSNITNTKDASTENSGKGDN